MASDQVTVTPAGLPLSPGAIALMLLLCLSWGFNQIAVKLVLPDIPPMLQATIRSTGALLVLFVIAQFRGVKMFERAGRTRQRLQHRRHVRQHQLDRDLIEPPAQTEHQHQRDRARAERTPRRC